jgi:hypothetical protein
LAGILKHFTSNIPRSGIQIPRANTETASSTKNSTNGKTTNRKKSDTEVLEKIPFQR